MLNLLQDQVRELQRHQHHIAKLHIRDMFQENPGRFNQFSIEAGPLFLDYSKNRINEETQKLLIDLARAAHLSISIEDMFAGKKINTTENRAAFHVALRNISDKPMCIDGVNVMPEIHSLWKRLGEFSTNIRQGEFRGYTNKTFKDIVNIGIGGSDLGPEMVVKALEPYHDTNLRFHFVSNIDGAVIKQTLAKLDPATTLFIISSKSFSTQETLQNTETALKWLSERLGKAAIARHFVAITANADAARAIGVRDENIFPMWDWVGGRFSIWSAIGLPVIIAIGMERFKEFLAGAHEMDEHFQKASYEKNMPVIMALMTVWYVNFFGSRSYAIIPYNHYLSGFPAYIQQAEMESNGKSRRHNGSLVDYHTSPVVWGSVGSNGQHTFHQLFMQGTQLIPIDFILPLTSHHNLLDHHAALIANCLSQSQALMSGNFTSETDQAALHKIVPGNRPSNTITFEKLTPYTLGSLIALYEHKVYVQGVIWGINSFDQWGVELGKNLAKDILEQINKNEVKSSDSSTRGLIDRYLKISAKNTK